MQLLRKCSSYPLPPCDTLERFFHRRIAHALTGTPALAKNTSRSQASAPVSARKEALSLWVTSLMTENQSFSQSDQTTIDFLSATPLQLIGGDAGFRKYYRLQTPQQTMIAVDAPPATEDIRTFVNIARQWKQGGLRVPQIYAIDYDHGFMLQEDFGDTPLQTLLENGAADEYYPKLLDLLLDIQKQPSSELPLYDEKLIRFELSLYPQWFLSDLLELDITDATLNQQLQPLFEELTQTFLAQPQGTIHRDYHSRNLMLTPDNNIGIIDFQGALHGPLLYDVVSLLKDCYVVWPEEKIQPWLSEFLSRHPTLSAVDTATIIRWLDLTGLQRHLKCLGIFSRLCLRDQKPDYLNNLPGTLEYVLACCRKYPQLQTHGEWLENNVKPILQARMGRVSEGVEL